MPTNVSVENFTDVLNETNLDVPDNQSTIEYYMYYYSYDTGYLLNLFWYQLDLFLWEYISFVIVLLSFIGNTIVIVVLLQKRSRNFSTSVYITSLAAADTFACCSVLEGWLLVKKFIRPTYSDIDCKLRLFIPKTAQYVSVWMLVAISLERAISVKLPHKVKQICTVKLARCFVVVVWILASANVSLNASIVSLIVDYEEKECFISIPNYYEIYVVELVLYSAFAVIIPYPIILICTTLTISTLVRNKISKSRSNKMEIKSISLALILVNLVYLVSLAPSVILEIYTLFWLRFNDKLKWTFEEYNNYVTMLNLFTFLGFIHHAVNFLIYFLSGSRFRQETKDLFRSCFHRPVR